MLTTTRVAETEITLDVQLLKEQSKYDKILLGLFDRVQRILPLVETVADEIVCDETDILEEIIPRMFKVMQRVAEYSRDYVRRGRLGMQIIAARTVSGLVDPGTIEGIEKDLSMVIEDFDRAVNVEALRQIKETGEDSLLVMAHSHLLRVEQGVLFRRLEPVETNYHLDFDCMDDTREMLLEQVIDWATKEWGQKQGSNTYWIYGPPGIGKTSLAHSICARLHMGDHLAGAFFCQRDDARLNKPRNILPTLIHKLAGVLPPFRSVVAERLRNDPHLTPGSMNYTLLHELICKLPRPPKRTLVFVIDAADECGNDLTRQPILRALIDAAAHAPWLKILLTSRPEADLHRLFDFSSHERYALGNFKTFQDDTTKEDSAMMAPSQAATSVIAPRLHSAPILEPIPLPIASRDIDNAIDDDPPKGDAWSTTRKGLESLEARTYSGPNRSGN